MNTPILPAVEGPVDRQVRPRPDDSDIADTLSKALRRAYSLGQTYWQQADSDSYAQNRRSYETQRKFDALVDEVRDALFAHCKVVAEAEQHACSIAVWMTKMDATADDADDLTAVNNELRAERDALRADAERLRAALEVYADPSFYHACSFMFDRPTGGFDEDFDYDDEYERDMPGKHARETLAAIDAAMAQKD